METTNNRKRGPVPNPNYVRAMVVLERDMQEWGKHQPGGLSELLRKLMREAMEKEKNKK